MSLGNVLSASSSSEKITFLTEADEAVFREWRGKSFEVQVAIHELLGHGSGKLLKETAEGKASFRPWLSQRWGEGERGGERWDSEPLRPGLESGVKLQRMGSRGSRNALPCESAISRSECRSGLVTPVGMGRLPQL